MSAKRPWHFLADTTTKASGGPISRFLWCIFFFHYLVPCNSWCFSREFLPLDLLQTFLGLDSESFTFHTDLKILKMRIKSRTCFLNVVNQLKIYFFSFETLVTEKLYKKLISNLVPPFAAFSEIKCSRTQS